MIPVRILVVLGSGGHTAEMIRLTEELGPNEYEYVVASDDPLSAGKTVYPGPVHVILNPRKKSDRNPLLILVKTVISLAQSVRTVARSRAEVIVGCGPAIAVPVMVLGKLLGKRIVFIENSARVETRSTSGRILYYFSDLFLVQWPSLTGKYKRAVWKGRLM
jgi:beta-1,4-N-acetylglucosaminyltransferase